MSETVVERVEPAPAPVPATARAGDEQLRYMPALDGLRALAVAAVLAYHADLGWARGGFLGVDVFFVLSGFLITGLLLADRDRHGRIRLGRFFRRRALRLLPALITLLVVVSLAIPFLAPDQAWRLRGDLLAALGYVSNWWLVLQDQSYFQAIGRPPVLQHLWSLAVEEQFYIVWPLVLGLAMRWVPARRRLGGWVLLGAGASAALMAALHEPGTDPSRVYYGTDTRVAALLIGAALACLWPHSSAPTGRMRRGVLGGVGLIALAGLALCMARVDEFEPGLYQGGFLGVALLAATVVAVGAARQPTFVGRMLGSRPLVWTGKRSYAIYLWFWPVFMLTRPHADVPLSGVPLLVLRVSLTVAIAAASYRFVETPAREGALGRAWAAARDGRRTLSTRWVTGWGLTLLVCVGALGTGLLVGHRAPGPPPELASAATSEHVVVTLPPKPETATETTVEPPVALPAAETVTTLAPLVVAAGTSSPATPSPLPQQVIRVRVTAIGESVLLEGKALLDRAIEPLGFDAAIGRQVPETIEAARALRNKDQLGEIVILHVGNNGLVTAGQLEELLDVFAAVRRVVVVNVKVPRPWEEPNNEVLAKGVVGRPNAVLADWHGLASANPEIFTDDGVHMKPEGVELYVRLIVSTF